MNMNLFKKLYWLFLLIIFSLMGCSTNTNLTNTQTSHIANSIQPNSLTDTSLPQNESLFNDTDELYYEDVKEETIEEVIEIIEMQSIKKESNSNIELIFVEPSSISESSPENSISESTTSITSTTPITENLEKKLIVIDAGHQAKGNYELEPIAPNATEQKAKVSSGTQGRFTGIPEFELTLIMAQKLEAILFDMGYQVLQVRDTHDINISNSERAMIANEHNADAFIRIHANGSDDASIHGAFTICPTIHNPYCADIYEDSRLLSEYVLQEFIKVTGAYERPIWETDTMSGINWCTVPVTIIEMGFMTNQEEDLKMATDSYQNDMALGMANGIHAYITHKSQVN